MRAKLFPLKGEPKRRKFLILDLETKNGDTQSAGFTRPFLAGVYDGKVYTPYHGSDCVALALKHVLRAEYCGFHIYAHNGGRFDFLFLLPHLVTEAAASQLLYRIIPVSSAIQVLDVWHPNSHHGKWRFLDSVKLIPMTLDKAAKTFGVENKMKFDLNTPDTEVEAWSAYNRIDCIALYQVLEKFHDYVEGRLNGEVGITAPSTSMRVYRRNYLPFSLSRNQEHHGFFRSAYFGGRTEAYFRGKAQALNYYDINSSYPAAMLENMPVGKMQEWEGAPHRKLVQQLGFVECEVEQPPTDIPVLPVRHENKLMFPVGRLKGVWTWHEIKEAIDHGATVTHWGKSVWFEGKPIFRGMVEDLYKFRDKSLPDYDEGLAAISKLMLNSLYGKFGQRTLRRHIYSSLDPDLPLGAIPCNGDIDCPVWTVEEESDASYIMPQLSAYVTSYARIALRRFMMQAKHKGGRIYYVDTDSIITDVELETTTKLGGLKLEESGKDGVFVAPKLYALADKVVAKGFEKQHRTLLHLEQLLAGQALYGKRLEKIGGMIRNNLKSYPRMIEYHKQIRLLSTKRDFDSNGWSKPYYIDMLTSEVNNDQPSIEGTSSLDS